MFTITRASGLEWQGKLDVLWEVYFQIVAAEVGLILVAMTSFRALFVSRTARNHPSPPEYGSFWAKSKSVMRRLLDPRQWSSKDTSQGQRPSNTEDGLIGDLPGIPAATMTGMQTFINHQGETIVSDGRFSTGSASLEAHQDNWPLSKHASVLVDHEKTVSHG